MIKKTYRWKLIDNTNENTVMRYCHNCGRKVIFRDSGKRRRNANGKTIFQYAIFKCDKDHTWNLPVNTYKSSNGTEHPQWNDAAAQICSSCDILDLEALKSEGINEIEIILEEITGRWRIDKLLGDRIRDLSRRKICELIEKEKILLDGKVIKQDSILKKQQRILILLTAACGQE